MLPKKLFVIMKKRVEEIVLQYKDETKGKKGLAAVPIEIGRQIEDSLRFHAREQHVRVNDSMIQAFLLEMQKVKLITIHPWGGWMVPQQNIIPDVKDAKSLVLETINKLQ